MVQQRLKENDWKQNGLTKRTTGEKIKHPKTQVSEALRDYANVATRGIDQHDRKAAALQAIKDKLGRCRQNHNGNRQLLAHITLMEQDLNTEVQNLNRTIDDLTVDDILADAAATTVFLDYCRNVEHNEDPFDLVVGIAKGTSRNTLYTTYVAATGSKALNFTEGGGADIKRRLDADHNDGAAWDDAKTLFIQEIKSNELPRFKKKKQVVLR
jgi:hypothetical protein